VLRTHLLRHALQGKKNVLLLLQEQIRWQILQGGGRYPVVKRAGGAVGQRFDWIASREKRGQCFFVSVRKKKEEREPGGERRQNGGKKPKGTDSIRYPDGCMWEGNDTWTLLNEMWTKIRKKKGKGVFAKGRWIRSAIRRHITRDRTRPEEKRPFNILRHWPPKPLKGKVGGGTKELKWDRTSKAALPRQSLR